MSREPKKTYDALNALRIGNIEQCTLASLIIGDVVLIEHAHLFENGYWQCWNKQIYKYLGFKGDKFHFENVKDKHEHFRMKEEVEDCHKLIGRYLVKSNESTEEIISIPLKCPKCKSEVTWNECYVDINDSKPVRAEETCPDCTVDGDFSDLKLFYN